MILLYWQIVTSVHHPDPVVALDQHHEDGYCRHCHRSTYLDLDFNIGVICEGFTSHYYSDLRGKVHGETWEGEEAGVVAGVGGREGSCYIVHIETWSYTAICEAASELIWVSMGVQEASWLVQAMWTVVIDMIRMKRCGRECIYVLFVIIGLQYCLI